MTSISKEEFGKLRRKGTVKSAPCECSRRRVLSSIRKKISERFPQGEQLKFNESISREMRNKEDQERKVMKELLNSLVPLILCQLSIGIIILFINSWFLLWLRS
jgi:hypothetical protein